MALQPAFLEMCSTTVAITPLSTFTVSGAPQYSTTTSTYPAAVEYARRKIVTREGKEEVASATVFVMSSSASISVFDQLAMRGTTNARILRADPVHDDEGLHHWELSVD